MPTDRIQALEGLKGLNEISEEERRKFLLDNEDKLRQYADRPRLRNKAAEILYNNYKFKNTFGEDAFNSLNDNSEASYNARNKLLREKVISDAFAKEFSPVDDSGNVDVNRGLGKEYNKYNGLSLDAKEELLRSDYKTPAQLEEEMNKKRGWTRLLNPVVDFLAGDAIMQYKREANQQILDKIFSDDADSASKQHDKEISSAYYNTDVTGINDDDTKNKFVQAITPGSYIDENGNVNRGVSEYAANYGTGENGEISDAMKNFTIDEMRQLLAKKYVLDRTLSPDLAKAALDNEALRYIKDHQSTAKRLGLFTKDLLISTASYTADKVNGIANLARMAEDKISGMPTVYVDDMGNIIDPRKTELINNGDGSFTYQDAEGNSHSVHQQQVARTTLHNMGRNDDGSEDESILNPQFWTRAEQFGTLDKDEQEQYSKVGASPYKVAWDPGEESNLWYESFKMTSFVLADAVTTLIPFGIGAAGKALSTAGKVGQVTRGFGSALNWAGRGLSTQTKAGQLIQGGAGALGIAYAYQRGAFQETLAQNLANAEEALIDRSRQEIFDQYNGDSAYKASVDNLIKMKAAELKSAWLAQNGENAERSITNQASFDEMIQARAQEAVLGDLVRRQVEDNRASKEYAQLQQEAIDSAGDAATISFLPEAIKYGLVNTIGFRKWIYTNPTQLAQKTFKGIKEITTAEGKKRLSAPSTLSTMKEKAKKIGKTAASQFWGGSWTNGTDDMMVDAAERINQDSYQEYLSSYSKGEALADTYGFVDGLYSYWKGLQNSMGQGTTINAALVGGIGSIVSAGPNMVNIASLATKEGRQAYRDTFQKRIVRDENGLPVLDKDKKPVTEDVSAKENWRDRFAFFIQNGVLSEYYGAKQSEKELQNHADYINNFLNYYEDFDAIEDLMNSTFLHENAEDVENEKTMKFVKAIDALNALNHLANNEKEPGSLSSVVQDKLAFIEKASQINLETGESPFTQEETANMLSEYYAANPTVPQNDQNNQIAIEQIARNAKKFMEAYNAYEKAEVEVQKAEKEFGKPISYEVRKKMKLQQALDGHWRERFDTMQQEIGDTADVYAEISDNDIIPSIGGRKNAERLITVYNKQEEELRQELEKQKKKTEEAQKQYDEDIELAKKAKTSDERYMSQVALESSYLELENARMQEDYVKQIINETALKKKKIEVSLKALEEGAPDRVFTADEIMSLDPVTRARVLNRNNRAMYSEEQVAEIEKLEKRLDTEDKSKLQKIQDIARLAQRIRANEDAYSKMSRNPGAAALEIENERKRAAYTAHKLITRKNAEILVDYLNEMDQAFKSKPKDYTEEERKNGIYYVLRKYNSTILGLIKEENMLPEYQSELEKALGWRETAEDLSNVITELARKKEDSKDWEKNLRANIRNIIENAQTRDEIIAELNGIINDASKRSSLGDAAAQAQALSDLSAIMDYMQKLGYQRNVAKKSDAENKVKQDTPKETPEEVKEKPAEQPKKSELNPENVEVNSIADVTLPLDEAQPEEKKEERKEEKTGEKEGEETLPPPPQVYNPVSGNESESQPGLSGTAMSEWEYDLIKDDGMLKHKVGAEPNDSMNNYFSWMKAAGIKLQNITDRELGRILRKNPRLKLKFMAVKTVSNATHDNVMKNTLFLVVDYDDKINRGVTTIHDKSNGGVVETDGKEYLIIGTVGYKKGNTEKQGLRDILFSNDPKGPTGYGLVRRGMGKFFKEHTSERFYVPENLYTEIIPGTLADGFIVNQLETDTRNDVHRSISELLEDERNPRKIKFKDLVFGIQTDKAGFIFTNNKDEDTLYKVPVKPEENEGRIFLFIPSGTGAFIPVHMDHTFYHNVQEGNLKDMIHSNLMNAVSPNQTLRKQALEELNRLFVFNKKTGKAVVENGANEIQFIENGNVIDRFVIDGNTDRQEFIAKFKLLDPMININIDTLNDLDKLKMYDKAGVLTTDAAMLHTASSSFRIFTLDEKGNIKREDTVGNILTNKTYTDPIYQSVIYNNEEYSYNKRTGKFTLNGTVIEDENTLLHLKYNQRIGQAKLKPSYSTSNWDYFVLSRDEHPEVIKRDKKSMRIEIPSEENAKAMLKVIDEASDVQRRKEAAVAALNDAVGELDMNSGNIEMNNMTGEITFGESLQQPSQPVASQKPATDKKQNGEPDKSSIENNRAPSAPSNSSESFVNVETFVRNKENREKLMQIIRRKWPDAKINPKNFRRFLEEKASKSGNKIELDMIDSSENGIKAWLKTIDECR